MLSRLFLGLSLIGAEWVLYLLLILSVVSIGLIFERVRFYKDASRGLHEFRRQIRAAADGKNWSGALEAARKRVESQAVASADLEAQMTVALLAEGSKGKATSEVLNELAQDSVIR